MKGNSAPGAPKLEQYGNLFGKHAPNSYNTFYSGHLHTITEEVVY